MPTTSSAVRLFVILARKAPLAVVFRRGPSKQVQLITWDTKTDHFEYGQWFKGRIYERRCDLSPSGKKLIYFAAKFKGPLYSWTAISNPPYLTALALWPKGDTWDGGGLFDSERVVLLNHGPIAEPPSKGHLPHYVTVMPLRGDGSRAEDDPIYHQRLTRDGWELIQDGHLITGRGPSMEWVYDPPRIFRRGFRVGGRELVLEMHIKGVGERQGPWYVVEHRVVSDRELLLDLGKSEWADWDGSGDLLFAANGRLHRLKRAELKRPASDLLGQSIIVADFRGGHFAETPAPDAALRW